MSIPFDFTGEGFTVDHVEIEKPFNVRDEYLLMPEGPAYMNPFS